MAFDYRTEYQRYKQYYTNLQRFYQKPITRVSVFVVISFMTVCFFSVFAIRPTLVTIGQLVKEIEDKQQQLEQKLTDLARAQAEYSQVSEDLPLIWQAVPDTPDVSRLLLELELAAIQSQVSLVNLQVEPVTLVGQLTKSKDKGPAKMTFTVTAGGNFNQVKGFAENLEKLGFKAKINI